MVKAQSNPIPAGSKAGTDADQTQMDGTERIETELKGHLSTQLNLCDELEKIADNLPHAIDRQHVLVVAKSIIPTVKSAHQFEENQIFPMIKQDGQSGASLDQSMERLRYEHWEDESFAEELSDALVKFVSLDEEAETDTLAYMLRGFFEGLRRHIAFESEHILPVLQQQFAKAI